LGREPKGADCRDADRSSLVTLITASHFDNGGQTTLDAGRESLRAA
jgi:hypothetical protein